MTATQTLIQARPESRKTAPRGRRAGGSRAR